MRQISPFGNGKPQKRAGPATRERRSRQRVLANQLRRGVLNSPVESAELEPVLCRLHLERTLSDLFNQAYALTPAEIDLTWQITPPRLPIPAPAT